MELFIFLLPEGLAANLPKTEIIMAALEAVPLLAAEGIPVPITPAGMAVLPKGPPLPDAAAVAAAAAGPQVSGMAIHLIVQERHVPRRLLDQALFLLEEAAAGQGIILPAGWVLFPASAGPGPEVVIMGAMAAVEKLPFVSIINAAIRQFRARPIVVPAMFSMTKEQAAFPHAVLSIPIIPAEDIVLKAVITRAIVLIILLIIVQRRAFYPLNVPGGLIYE